MTQPTAVAPLDTPSHSGLHNNIIDVAGMFGTSSSAVAQAFAAATAGTTLWFGDYTFSCSVSISNVSGLTLTGSRKAVLQGPGGADPTYIILTDCDNIEVHGLSFDMNGVLSFGGLKFYGVHGLNVHDNYFYDSNFQSSSTSDHFGLITVGSDTARVNTDLHVHHNRFDHCQVELDHVQGATVDHNVSRSTWHTTAFGMFTTTSTHNFVSSDITFDSNVVIDPLYVSSAAFTLSVDPATSTNHTFSRISFTNNKIFDSTGFTAFRFGTVDNSQTATNVTFSDITVENNEVIYSGAFTGRAIFLNASTTAGFDLDRVKIANNKLYGTGDAGSIAMDVRATTDSYVYDNLVSGFDQIFNEGGNTNLATWTPTVGLAVDGNTAGTLTGGVQVFDAGGTSLGYVPVYASISFAPVETTASTLYGWYKAGSFSLADGEQPYWWDDSSTTTTNDLSAPGATNFPTYKTGIVNGEPVLRFAGNSNEYLWHQTTPVVAQPFSYVAVVNPSNKTDNHMFISTASAAAAPNAASMYTTSTNGYAAISAPTERAASTDLTSAWHVYVGIFNGASSKIWIDGTNVVTADPGANGFTGIKIGANWTGAARFVGDVAEVIVYGGALSDTDRNALETYLGAKYNIVVV